MRFFKSKQNQNELDRNFVASVLDEVALEGLDGVTFPALLLRLGHNSGLKWLQEDPNLLLDILLSKIISTSSLTLYQLPQSRPSLVMYDRYTYVDPDLGSVYEPADSEIPTDPYPFKLISDGMTRGSCTDYHSRIDISDQIQDLDFRRKLMEMDCYVFVASLELRIRALLPDDPCLYQTLTPMQWAILERIGRSRWQGEVTQGKQSLLKVTGETSMQLFYHRKTLIKLGLVTKQVHNLRIHKQNVQGLLFHLPRFHVERRSKSLVYAHATVKYLLAKKDGLCSVEELLQHLQIHPGSSGKKLLKSQDFTRFVRTDVRVPISFFQEDQKEEEEEEVTRSSDNNKEVRSVALKDPNMDPEEVWSKVKDEDLDMSKMENDDDDEFFVWNTEQKESSTLLLDRSAMWQAVKVLQDAGAEGLSQTQLGHKLGLDKYEARSIVRNLLRRDLAKSFMFDSGRQRMQKLVAKVFEDPTIKEKQGLDDSLIEDNEEESVSKGMTVRQIRRTNAILEAVRLNTVVEDPFKLQKLILDNEALEGYDTTMDRKSLHRLLAKMANAKQIKLIDVKIKSGEKEKTLGFICQPYVTEDHTLITSAVEQAKIKFGLIENPMDIPDFILPDFEKPSIGESFRQVKDLHSEIAKDTATSESPTKPNQTMCGRQYGLQPKFVRMREFHQFLFYVCRSYEGHYEDNQDAFIQTLISDQVDMSGDVIKELNSMKVYRKDLSWKTFVPPLPVHAGWPQGWCLMSDVILRMPLSLFVMLVNTSSPVPGLEDYLSHPLKKHYLVRMLPVAIRNGLLAKRKYIFTLHETACRLCYMGALQFGPNSLKEKDQVFVYVNRKVAILNTISSGLGYHQVQAGKDYPELGYVFNSLTDVETYWCDLFEICMCTKLGHLGHLAAGQELTLDRMEKKAEMLDTLKAKKANQIQDLGHIPGDHLGAAGLDSCMFAHLKRNWSWNSRDTSAVSLSNPRKARDAKFKATYETKKSKADLKKKAKGQQGSVKATPFPVKAIKQARAATITRVVKKREPATPRRPYYDEADKAALRLMKKLRVDWSDEEDSFLLLCKVAGTYLCQNYANHNMVPYFIVRDELHLRFEGSKNKTSRACQRRINYMLRNEASQDSVTLFYADVQQDPEVLRTFPVPDQSVTSKDVIDERLKKDFGPLVDFLLKKYKSQQYQSRSGLDQVVQVPDDILELERMFHIVHPASGGIGTAGIGEKSSSTCDDANDKDEVSASVINAVIMSSLCSTADKANWSFQLFKIYQQYPDALLRSVMAKLRSDKMVSVKKSSKKMTSKRGQNNYLPLSSSPYQLSVTFSHKFLSRYQYSIFGQSWDLTKQLLKNVNAEDDEDEGVEVIINGDGGGFASAIIGYMALDRLRFTTEVPEQIVVLDPNLSAVDEQYVRILQRYKELLKNSDNMEHQDHQIMDKKITSTDLFRNAPDRKRKKDQEEHQVVAKKRIKVVDDQGSPGGVVFKGLNDDQGGLVEENRSTIQVAKSASRIALYMMREELKGGDQAITIQHSHDYFVVSSCRVFAKLLDHSLEEEKEEKIRVSGDLFANASLLPGDQAAKDTVLKSFGVFGSGMANQTGIKDRKTTLPKDVMAFEDYYKTLPDTDAHGASVVYECILQKEVTGASIKDLKGLPLDITCIERVLKAMLKAFVVIRAGVASPRFVANVHASPWILHSFRLSRTKQKEAAPDTKFANKLYEGHSQKSDIGAAADKMEPEVDMVDVFIRPWIRIDGSLNRRILDQMMASVLGHLMQRPGMTLANLADKIAPAIQPMHCLELVETLADVGCVSLKRLDSGSPPRLFQPTQLPQLLPYSLLTLPHELVIDPMVDAVLKLGQFIGDKNYTSEICACTCHPY